MHELDLIPKLKEEIAAAHRLLDSMGVPRWQNAIYNKEGTVKLIDKSVLTLEERIKLLA